MRLISFHPSLQLLGLMIFLASGCGEATEPVAVGGDARDDSFFVASGGGDHLAPEENSGEARAILEVVNNYSIHTLVRDAGLYWSAAQHIVEHRNGADGVRNTDDDMYLRSMTELDDVPYVGKVCLQSLREYVKAEGLIEDHTVQYVDAIPARIDTRRGAAFRGTIAAEDLINVRIDGQAGDRILVWLRKADDSRWNPRIKVVDAASGEVVGSANPWGNSDARFPLHTEEASRGWEIDRAPAAYSVVLDNTSANEGTFEFLLECVGGPCFADGKAAPVLDGDFGSLGDEELRAQMVARHELTHIYLDYYAARKIMFEALDNDDGRVECAYSGDLVETRTIPDNSVMNAEHTWPQSKGAVDGAARSDLHHLFPVISTVNSTRAAYPYCEVGEVVRELGPATLGLDDRGVRCFEPREQHKGDAARAMFYFAAVYQQSIDEAQEAVLRRWHEADPVSAGERARNESIEAIQGSRNFFVDRPELVERISDF